MMTHVITVNDDYFARKNSYDASKIEVLATQIH